MTLDRLGTVGDECHLVLKNLDEPTLDSDCRGHPDGRWLPSQEFTLPAPVCAEGSMARLGPVNFCPRVMNRKPR